MKWGGRVLSAKTSKSYKLVVLALLESHHTWSCGSAVNQKHRVFNIEAFPTVAQL